MILVLSNLKIPREGWEIWIYSFENTNLKIDVNKTKERLWGKTMQKRKNKLKEDRTTRDIEILESEERINAKNHV